MKSNNHTICANCIKPFLKTNVLENCCSPVCSMQFKEDTKAKPTESETPWRSLRGADPIYGILYPNGTYWLGIRGVYNPETCETPSYLRVGNPRNQGDKNYAKQYTTFQAAQDVLNSFPKELTGFTIVKLNE